MNPPWKINEDSNWGTFALDVEIGLDKINWDQVQSVQQKYDMVHQMLTSAGEDWIGHYKIGGKERDTYEPPILVQARHELCLARKNVAKQEKIKENDKLISLDTR